MPGGYSVFAEFELSFLLPGHRLGSYTQITTRKAVVGSQEGVCSALWDCTIEDAALRGAGNTRCRSPFELLSRGNDSDCHRPS